MQPFRNKAPVAEAAEVSKNLRRLNDPITLIDIFYEKGQTEKWSKRHGYRRFTEKR
ncbi:hypothetical protein NON20_06770 [Synechocystis sp. B12]|nr:hypothetical protein NON20_06770 [Synechocystis sp. B12]